MTAGPDHEADPLLAVREALDRGAWEEALVALDGPGVDPGSPDALVLRAQAAYSAGDLEGAIGAWEDLYALQVALSDDEAAAFSAAMVAMHLMMDTGLMAPVRAWLRRAEHLAAGRDDVPARALSAMVRSYERLMSGDPEAARDSARLAVELGTRLDVVPAVVIGRVALARMRIFDGEVDEGLEALDEIAVLLMSGAVDPLTTGMALCELICAMQGLARYDRADEWTQAMEHWRHGRAFGGINGRCRVHRAEMLRLRGPCDEAEAEALAACEELRPWMRREFGWPLAELGNIRLRRGDLEGAEEAFVAAHGHAWTPHPGLALLRLAQGRLDDATALIDDALDHPFDHPSKERPPFGSLRRAPLLDAQSEIAAARGDVSTTRAAAEELGAIAEEFDSPALRASAALARARAALAEGSPEPAVGLAAAAVSAWAEIGAPFETAASRMVLAAARQASGHPGAATLEWQAARDGFRAFGAVGWAEQAERMLRDGAPEAPARPRERRGTFTVDGDTRCLAFDGVTVHLRDLKGLRYLARLLADPGRELHVLDLVHVERGSLPTTTPGDEELSVSDGGDAGEHLDDVARDAYRRRLREIDEDIAEATEHNDLGRVATAQTEKEYLVAELSRAIGLTGRPRRAGDTAERARMSVSRAVRYAVARVAEQHPPLGEHLRHAVRTGTYCVYRPDPAAPVSWEV